MNLKKNLRKKSQKLKKNGNLNVRQEKILPKNLLLTNSRRLLSNIKIKLTNKKLIQINRQKNKMRTQFALIVLKKDIIPVIQYTHKFGTK